MKRIIAVIAALAMVAGMASAAPSIYGSNGLIRTISAANAGAMNYGIGIHGLGWMWSADSSASNPGGKVTVINGQGVVNGYFSINEMLEISVAVNGLGMSQKVGSADAATIGGLGDTRVGLKGSFKAAENITLGLYAGYDIPTLADKLNPYATDTIYKRNGMIDGRALAGFTFGNAKLDVNAGIAYTLDKYEVGGINRYYPNMAIPFGVGFSYDMGMITTFAEASAMLALDTISTYAKGTGITKRGLLNNPTWVGAGVRLYVLNGLNIDVAGEYNLQDQDSTLDGRLANTEHWHGILGLAWAPKAQKGPKVVPTGSITGKVTDAKDGKALTATVTVGGLTAQTDPATGVYTVSGIEITGAPVEIKADNKLYVSKTGSVILTKKNKKTPAEQNFALDKKPIPQSEITGNLIDYKTGSPVVAVLTFKDAKGKTMTAKTDAKGAYSIKLDPGKYDVQVAADGYNAKSFVVNAAEGKPVSKSESLVKQKEVFAFSNINFASGKSVVTPVIVTALEPLKKVLMDNPTLKVEIAGHTDNIGSKAKNLKLSQARAEAIVVWLTEQGVKASMTAKGYGSSAPIATNKTKVGRAQNRRIEIKVAE